MKKTIIALFLLIAVAATAQKPRPDAFDPQPDTLSPKAVVMATTLEEMVSKMNWQRNRTNYAVVYGETDLVDNEGNFLRHRRLQAPEKLTSKSFRSGMLVCHQSFYVRTDLAKATPYDLHYRYSADYDWCIRLMQRAEKRRLRFLNSHLILTDYLSEGLTTKNHRSSLLERFRLMTLHYGWGTALAEHLWFVVRAIIKR